METLAGILVTVAFVAMWVPVAVLDIKARGQMAYWQKKADQYQNVWRDSLRARVAVFPPPLGEGQGEGVRCECNEHPALFLHI